MARLIFSNNSEIVERFVTYDQRVGFIKYSLHEYEGKKIGATFNKLEIEHCNNLEQNGNVVSIVGTYLYKGKIGGRACQLVLEDFLQTRDIVSIRDNMSGHFAMVIVCDGFLYAISDNMGVHYMYYHIGKDGGWIIGNSLYEMVKVSPFACHVDEFNLLEESYSHCIYGDDTLFNEFKKLTGEKYLKVNLVNNAFEVLSASKPQFIIDTRDSDEIALDLSKELSLWAKEMKTVSWGGQQSVEYGQGGRNDIALCMTGGIDARVTLAAFMSEGIKPTLYYGVGNSKLTNTKEGDLRVDKMFQSRFGLELKLMNYRNSLCIGKDWDNLVDTYGLLDHFSTVTPNLKKEFRKVSEPLHCWNFFGEMFRNVDLIEKREDTTITVEEIVKRHYLSEPYMKYVLGEDYEAYKQHIIRKVHQAVQPYLDKEGTLPIEYFVVYDYYRRINCDTHKMNMCNQYRYCLAPLADWRFLKYMTATVSARHSAKILLKVIELLYPELLDIPFFSHQYWRKFDKATSKMDITDVDNTKYESEKNMIVRIPSHYKKTRVYEDVKIIYHYLKGLVKNGDTQFARESYSVNLVSKKLIRMVKRYPFFIRSINPLQVPYLPMDAHLVLLLFTMEKLGIKELQ